MLSSDVKRSYWHYCRRIGLLELCGYLLLACAATWPLVWHWRDRLPLGTEPVPTVPLFNAWTIWWNADRVSHFYRDYWNAPIFYPTGDAFAFSEPMPLAGLLAPVVWTTGSSVAAYNVWLLGALTLNGWSAFHLLRRVHASWWVAAAGGAVLQSLPFVHWQLGVLQLVPLCGVVWTMHALVAFADRPTASRAVVLGCAWAAAYLLCAHYGLFLGMVLPPAAVWLLLAQLRKLHTWTCLGLAALVGFGLVSPMVVVQLRAMRAHEFERRTEQIERLSARPHHYLDSPWPPLVGPAEEWRPPDPDRIALNPGLAKCLLAAAGVIFGFLHKPLRRWTGFCLSVLVIAFLLSLGPHLTVGAWIPYWTLRDWVPGFAQVRNIFRFGVLVQIMSVFLAAITFQACLAKVGLFCRNRRPRLDSQDEPTPGGPPQQPRTWRKSILSLFRSVRDVAGWSWRYLLVVILAGVATIEIWPRRQELFAPPPRVEFQPLIDWLTSTTPSNSVLACVPFPSGRDAHAYFETALCMHLQTFHERRLVNGYSGFFPESYLDLKDAMQTFPDAGSIDLLTKRGVDYCVVRRSAVSREAVAADRRASRQLQWVFGDSTTDIDVYRLRR